MPSSRKKRVQERIELLWFIMISQFKEGAGRICPSRLYPSAYPWLWKRRHQCSSRTKNENRCCQPVETPTKTLVAKSRNRRCDMYDIVSRTTPRVLSPKGFMNLLVSLSPLTFPLATKNRAGWNGKRKGNRDKPIGILAIALRNKEITPDSQSMIVDSDKGMDKASYKKKKERSNEHLFHQLQEIQRRFHFMKPQRYFPSVDNRVPPIIAEQVGIRSSSPVSKNITTSGIYGIVEWAT